MVFIQILINSCSNSIFKQMLHAIVLRINISVVGALPAKRFIILFICAILGFSCCYKCECLFNTGVDGKVLHLACRPPPDERRVAAERRLSPHPDDDEHAGIGTRNTIVGTFPVRVHGNISPQNIQVMFL